VLKFLFPAYPTYQVFMAAGFAALFTIIFTPLWLRFSQSKNIGQIVRTDGPDSHLKKHGTPTMGGLILLFSTAISFFLLASVGGLTLKGEIALLVTAFCAFIGFIDDYLKVVKVRSLGLPARYKLTLQGIVGFLLFYISYKFVKLPSYLLIPILNIKITLPLLVYLVFVILLVMATTNSVNLTDGLDGLAAGTASVVCFVLAAIAFRQGQRDLAIFGAAVAGACIGFLWYNSYPAEIFMGDTGSLALGGAIASLSVLTKTEFFLLIIGGIYVIEALSVILQVVIFRRTGKRLFRMSPIHHHFEMLGWSETKVMVRFLIFTAALAGWGFVLYFVGASR